MGFRKQKSFYEQVKKNITQIREQGESPRMDLASLDTLDVYICDLCQASVPRAELIQCTFCGRWVCKDNCFDRDDVACLNCYGVIKLLRESQKMDRASERGDVLLEERKAAARDALAYRKKKEDLDRLKKEHELDYMEKRTKVEHKRRIKELKRKAKEPEEGTEEKPSGMLGAIRKLKGLRGTGKDRKKKEEEDEE